MSVVSYRSDAAFEIASQPTAWRMVRGRTEEAAAILPGHGRNVAVVGCGTSFYIASAYAALRQRREGPTEAHAASEYPRGRAIDHLVAISRSGTTTEVLDLLVHMRTMGVPTTAIVATPGTPVADAARATLVLDEVDEKSVVQTRFATTVLALLRYTLGEDLEATINAAAAVLGEPEASALSETANAEQVTFIGRGWTVGLAQEAALKLRESAQIWTEAYPAMEYRHGPISIATRGRAVWALGDVPPGLRREVLATGAHFEHRDVDPMAELVRVHRLCLYRAALSGLDPDRPRHLTRSVVLA